jgi:hypothetical protein
VLPGRALRALLIALLLLLGAGHRLDAQEEPAPAGESGKPGPVIAPPLDTATAFTLLGAAPRAEVYVDGVLVGMTPLPGRTGVTPGSHQLKVSRRGYTGYSGEFTAFEKRLVAIEIEMSAVAAVLKLTLAPTDSQLFLDEELQSDFGGELELKSGQRQLRVHRSGYRDQLLTLTVVAGDELERSVTLELLPEEKLKVAKEHRPEQRWYQRWWVWPIAAVAAVGIAAAIVVPVVLSQRSDCDKLGGEVCLSVVSSTPALTVRF